ncbi:hypothetical protein [Nakamurella multipartita]|uniref:ATPase involved in chromosome partitioning-like protein n=1 Tax=Nakamurella multipartita (strain ATCC 700099 / DSM 44233 / CIP 104796 / JCM 9543 / NBRC 105858 / Y-104) TaxID=479431 RepID=C8X8Q4_NAKMY|nr:hypothetical protein [Nakamurella multipartita]ACV79109.1 hypothetical protein Namu_2763 [Nakamurella multipartita DSM 44233]
MIVAVCSDKGSPGATTLATALGTVWPGDRALVDADTAGGDTPFRLWTQDREHRLAPSPSIAQLAAAARLGLSPAGALPFSQLCSLGLPVVPGMLSADRALPLRGLWPRLASETSAWSGTVIADLGRLQPGNPSVAMAAAAEAVLVVTRVDLEGLARLRERVAELAAAVGDPRRDRTPVGVVVTGAPRHRSFALQQVRQVLLSIGSPVQVIGFFAQDPGGAQGLWEGRWTRRLAGSDLIRSARSVAESVLAQWPSLLPRSAQDEAEPDSEVGGIDDELTRRWGPRAEVGRG